MRRLALGDPHAWLITSACYIQTLDFYTEYLDLPDEELPDAVREAAVRWHWDGLLLSEEVARDIQLADMLLLLGDRRQVRLPFTGTIESMRPPNTLESCTWAPVSAMVSGTPLASVTACRVDPGLPQSRGLEPVPAPPPLSRGR